LLNLTNELSPPVNDKFIDEEMPEVKNLTQIVSCSKERPLRKKMGTCNRVIFRTNLLKVKERKSVFRVMSWLYSKAGKSLMPKKTTRYEVIPKTSDDFDNI
jgi:hypothetical protein